jgi:hypothetical protein
MGDTRISLWHAKPGSGQSLAVSSGSSSTFANALNALGDNQTRAFLISLAPTATATGALVKVSQAGTAATATSDILIKTTDPPLLLECAPGDKVSCYGLAACTAYLCEMTH